MSHLEDKTIIVLGPNGMLGQMVIKYFSKRNHLIRHDARFEFDNKEEFTKIIRENPDAIVINAIGRIKQKANEVSDLLWSNAVLPLELRNVMMPNQILVHPSTDCVFSGITKKPYSVTERSNAEDSYGWSKRMGEVALEGRPNTLIARVSIIGPDSSKEPKGLLGWFLSQAEGATLKGFENHFWNGITTLEWCKIIEKLLLAGDVIDGKTIQIGTEKSYSKYDLLRLFQKCYSTNYTIEKFNTPDSVDRRLVPSVHAKDLEEQLEELIEFSKIN